MASSPGPAFDVSEPSKKVSTVVFPPKAHTFSPPLYKDEVRREMERRGLQRLARTASYAYYATEEREELEDDLSLRSSSSQSIYHARSKVRRRKLGWRDKYKDCLSVARYAGKRAAVTGTL
jgi:hypothetical protein